jgi:hypothetical protein
MLSRERSLERRNYIPLLHPANRPGIPTAVRR